ncbi:MAG: S-layer homology domain-containing protein [Patescibacteria group bacterium]
MSKKTSPKKSAPAPVAQPAISPKALIFLGVILVVLTVTTLVYQRETPFLPNQLKTSLFTDISKEDQSSALVNSSLAYLANKDIMKGYPDGSFQPEKTLVRAEFLKILVAAVATGDIPDKKILCFSDVKIEDWFSKYVCYGKEKGWVAGYQDGTFKPGNTINQAELMKILVTGFGWNPEEFKDQQLPSGTDGQNWAAKYAKVMIAKNIMTKSEIDFAHLVTRKEVATIIFRALIVDSLKIDAYSESKIGIFFKLKNVVISGEAMSGITTGEPKPKSKPKSK